MSKRKKDQPSETPATCWKCGRISTRMRVENTQGGWNVCEWCTHCDCSAVRDRAWISSSGLDIPSMPIRTSRSEPWRGIERCEVCGCAARLECHHLAPWAQFGHAADRWPTVNVCRHCHEEWHERMGQPIGRRRFQ